MRSEAHSLKKAGGPTCYMVLRPRFCSDIENFVEATDYHFITGGR